MYSSSTISGPSNLRNDSWLIWSNEHGAWWRANACGYTTSLQHAGRYSFESAIRHSSSRSPLTIADPSLRLPPELPIPEFAAYALAANKGAKEIV